MALHQGLQALVTVAAHGSITAAAKELSYAPSTVGRHLRDLERHVGSPLLSKGWQGSELTTTALELIPLACALVCGRSQLVSGHQGASVGGPGCIAGDLSCAGLGTCPGTT
ncbi:MAG TPA: LysR family transcriptional regulator [Cellulomonas sp.]